jgi:hypothetical protein
MLFFSASVQRGSVEAATSCVAMAAATSGVGVAPSGTNVVLSMSEKAACATGLTA